MADVEITIETIDKNSDEIKKVADKLKQMGGEAAKAQERSEKLGAQAKKNTEDFSRLGSRLDEWTTRLKAATPANQAFAQRLHEVTKAYEKGAIGADVAKGKIEQIKTEMMQAAPAGEKFATAMKGAFAIFGGAAAAAASAKALFDQMMAFGEAGAQAAQTAESFGFLIQKLDLMPDLLERLRGASRGTIDDTSLMSSTITLLAGTSDELAQALGDATPRLLEIAKAANKLNPQLGDTKFMYESLALGIKRGSPMIIDNLGITLRIGEANEKFAKSLGKTVEELTSEELKMALLNEVMAKGGVLIEQAGGKADSAADSFARLKTAQANLTAAIQEDSAPALASLAEWILRTRDLQEDWNQGWMNAVPTLGGVRTAVAAVISLFTESEPVQENVTEITREQTKEVEALSTNYVDLSWAVDQTQQYYAILNDEAEKSIEKQKKVAELMPEIQEAYEGLTGAMSDLSASQTQWMESTGNEVANQLESAGIKGEKYKNALGAIDDVYGTSLGLQQQYQEELAGLIGEYKKTGDIDAFKSKLQELKDTYMPLNEQVAEATKKLQEFKYLWDSLESKAIQLDVDMPALPGTGSGGGNTSGVETQERNYGQDMNDNDVIGAFGGLDMTVPPGHPNDSFLIAARSGEEVKITPPGTAPDDKESGEGEVKITIQANLYYPIDEEQLIIKIANAVRRRQQ